MITREKIFLPLAPSLHANHHMRCISSSLRVLLRDPMCRRKQFEPVWGLVALDEFENAVESCARFGARLEEGASLIESTGN